MVTSEKLPEELMKELEAGSKEYHAQKKRNLANFIKFVKNAEKVEDPIEEIVTTPETFESYVKNYFYGIKVEEHVKDKKTGVARYGVRKEHQGIAVRSVHQGV